MYTHLCVSLSLSIYIHTYVYTCTHVYIYIYIYIYTCLCIYIYIYIYIHMYICMYVCVYIYIYIHTSVVHGVYEGTQAIEEPPVSAELHEDLRRGAPVSLSLYVSLSLCIYIYIYIYIHTYTHIHICIYVTLCHLCRLFETNRLSNLLNIMFTSKSSDQLSKSAVISGLHSTRNATDEHGYTQGTVTLPELTWQIIFVVRL